MGTSFTNSWDSSDLRMCAANCAAPNIFEVVPEKDTVLEAFSNLAGIKITAEIRTHG